MQSNELSSRLLVEDLSDCRSDSSHSETHARVFGDYERTKELNLSMDKGKDSAASGEPKDFHAGMETGSATSLPFDDFPSENSTRNLTMSLNKAKDFGYANGGPNEISYPVDRANDVEESLDDGTASLCRGKNPIAKDLLFNLRDARQKGAHGSLSSLDRCGKDLNFAVDREIKDFGLLKNYSLDRMKGFNLSLDRTRDGHVGNLAIERLRGGNAALLEAPAILDHAEFRHLQVQPRSTELEAIAMEHMRRSHLLAADMSPQNLSTQLPRAHTLTQMQHSQQQQQQQVKSFTIDAILGLRNNQREKRSQQQQYRKHHAQEGSRKNGSSSSCSTVSGKLKRVRTIFTAEQLERLEGEFARQQYMVGPERLYLAHALRLTEAQVKVWFQNRRIKWRKHHHEQQSQRVHEFQRSLGSSLEQEDSNETDKWHRARYASPHQSSSLDKYANVNNSLESYWRLPQRNGVAVAPCRSAKKASGPPAEASTSYFSTTHTYRPHVRHVCANPSRKKYSHVDDAQLSRHCVSQDPSKLVRANRAPDTVAALIGGNRYKDDEPRDDGNVKYNDEDLASFTEDDAGNEVEDDQDETAESVDKDYEERETDDDVADESDACPVPHKTEARRAEKGLPSKPLPRPMIAERHRDQPRLDYRQHARTSYQDRSAVPRYYHGLVERDAYDVPSEEDAVERSIQPKPAPRGSSADYRPWAQSGRARHRETASPSQPPRRARTKPEIETLVAAEPANARKCSRCGSCSGSAEKRSVARRSNCRFRDHASFAAKEPIGHEPDVGERFHRARCNPRQGPDANDAAYDIPKSILYSLKPRRSKGGRAPSYEAQQEGPAIERLSNNHLQATSGYPKEASTAFRELTRHSVAMTRAPNRTPPRYDH